MAAATRAARRVTRRAVGIGTLLCLFIGVGAPYSTHLLRGSYMDLDFSTPAAVFFLFVLVALVNPLLRVWERLSRGRLAWAVTPAEILVIYTMLIVACALTTMGMAAQLVPTLAAAQYYAKTQPAWSASVLPHIKPWLLPDAHASERLMEGLRAGEAIPWVSWAVPLAAWAVLLLAFYTASICLMAILRRPWVERERLAYPLTQLPLEMVRTGPRAGEPRPLLRDGVMWLGFATAFVLPSLRGLHHYWPSFPDVESVWQFPMFRDTTTLILRISFPMIGFFFLANPEVVFSLWVFNRIAWAVQGWMSITGVEFRAELGPYSAPPVFGYLGLGAFLALTFTTLRVAWPHLRAVATAALHPRASLEEEDLDEPIPYRVAFWGLIGGLAVMALWLYASGMPPLVVPLFLLGVLVIFLGLTRVVIESGMAEAVPPMVPAGFTHAVLGEAGIGLPAVAAQSLTYIWAGDIRTTVMTSAAHGYRLSDGIADNRRAMTGAMFLAILVTSVAAIGTTLFLGYTQGGVSLNSWFFVQGPQLPYKWIADRAANPLLGPNLTGWVLVLGGALFTGFLALLRQWYVWWPFHPVGFAIAPTWIMDQIWLSACLAWLCRVVIVRYGGRRGYQRLRPYFLGLILGQFTGNGFWLILDALSGMRGNQIFWI